MIGAVERVRPKMMTVVAIMAGLLPIMWSTGTGSEVMQRIAVSMIGGMVSSTLLTLVVIPAIYGLVKGWRLQSARASPADLLVTDQASILWASQRKIDQPRDKVRKSLCRNPRSHLGSIRAFDRSRSATRRAISPDASSGIGNTELTLISPST